MIIEFDPERRWFNRAGCLGMGTSVFYADGEPDRSKAPAAATQLHWDRAKAVCAQCPVRDSCRRDSLGEDFGVWGGLDQYERYQERRRLNARVRKAPLPERLELARQIAGMRRNLSPATVRRLTGLSAETIQELVGLHAQARLALDMTVEDVPRPRGSRRLNPQARQAIIALREQGLPQRAIAHRIGCAVTTVQGVLAAHRASAAATPFPEGTGQRDAWVRHEGRIFDCAYMGETADGAFYLMRIRSGARGGHTTKWVPAQDVRLHRPESLARVIKEYVAYAKSSKTQPGTGESQGRGDGDPASDGGTPAPVLLDPGQLAAMP